MSATIPGPRKRGFGGILMTRKAEAVVTGACALPGAALLAYSKCGGLDATSSARLGFDAALVSVVCLLLLAGYRFWRADQHDREDEQVHRPNVLMGPLLALYEAIKRKKSLTDSQDDLKKFRATLHRVDGDEHVQTLPYVGHTQGELDRVERRWSNACGLVGQAIRTGGPPDSPGDPLLAVMKEHVNTPDSYWRALMDLYGYDLRQAKAHEYGRFASLAIPINNGDPKNVIGVLYCDSSERDFFTPEIIELCVFSGIAIANTVKLMK